MARKSPFQSTRDVNSKISFVNRKNYFESYLCVSIERIGLSKRLLGTLESTEIYAGNVRF